jgi:hypothetical protein
MQSQLLSGVDPLPLLLTALKRLHASLNPNPNPNPWELESVRVPSIRGLVRDLGQGLSRAGPEVLTRGLDLLQDPNPNPLAWNPHAGTALAEALEATLTLTPSQP